VKAYLASIEIEVFEVDALFKLLADGDDIISYEEFLNGIMRLKGTARSQDVVGILHKLNQLQRELGSMKDILQKNGFEKGLPHETAGMDSLHGERDLRADLLFL